jgi:mannitol-1-phosphate 5-dehydrogenase
VKAVIIGTGRIACAVAGQLLRTSGYEVVFLGRNAQVVDHFNRTGRYLVRLVDSRSCEEHEVTGIRAVAIDDEPAAVAEIASADVIATSVGCSNLMAVAPLIANGLALRSRPANLLAFENFASASECLSQFIARALEGSKVAHGYSAALVTRVVARREGNPSGDELLVFIGDRAKAFYVDATTIRGPLRAIDGMIVTPAFDACVQRKLFTFSAGHATAAYLGFLKGYHYIHTAVRDREIRAAVLEAMREGQRALATIHGIELAGDESSLREILARFDNAELQDSIERVGRDPVRKLAAEDRLVGAARLARKAGIRPEKLMLAVAAAMLFCPLTDPSATALGKTIQCDGPSAALCRIAGFNPDDTLASSAVDSYRRLSDRKPEQSQLLRLEPAVWA